MAERIKRKAEELVLQLTQAAGGINAVGATWPAVAPTEAAVTNLAAALAADIALEANLEAQLEVARQAKKNRIEQARAILKTIDGFTDGLYGKDGAEKTGFGLPPISSGPSPFSGTPLQVVIRKVTDGSAPNSIFVDFYVVDGASSYEAEWFTDAAMTPETRVGNITITKSEFTATGLVKGQQYWFRVRAIRANEAGPWSDPATRVAGL